MKLTYKFIFISLFLIVLVLNANSQTAFKKEIFGRKIKEEFLNDKKVKYVNRLIGIKVKNNFQTNKIMKEFDILNYKIIRNFDKLGWATIEIPKGKEVFREIQKLKVKDYISAVEPIFVYHVSIEPNDPYFKGTSPATYPHQWALNNYKNLPPMGMVDADIDAVQAWDITTGDPKVIAAILDTGIPLENEMLCHPDLDDLNKIILGPDYIDIPSDGVKDVNGHGTHVAGIIGAETNNNLGIAGVAWNIKLLIIQVFNEYGYGTDDAFKNGVIYAVDYYRNHPGTKMIINYSGGGSSPSQKMEDAIAYANTYGIPIIVSAGNDAGSVSYPAAYSLSYSNVISVSATDHNDNISSYSNRGSEITVAAPGGYGPYLDDNITKYNGNQNRGQNIYSTTPPYSFNLQNGTDIAQNYGYMAGTSMAAPFVTGVSGLIFSVNSNYTATDLKNLLENTADDLGDPGFDIYYGYGRINALRAVAKAFVDANPSYTYTEGMLPLTLYKSDFEVTFLNDPAPGLSAGWYMCDVYVAETNVNKYYSTQPMGWYIGVEGYSGANPNDATLWVNKNLSTSSASFKTYFYYLKYNIMGQQVNKWAPANPYSKEGRNYVLVGIPDPLSVTITGPTYLGYNENGTFTANPSGGSGTYVDYRWWYRKDGGGLSVQKSGDVGIMAPIQGEWIEMTYNRGKQTITAGFTFDFSLKCEVTDSDGNTAYDIHSVLVGSGGGGELKLAKRNLEQEFSSIPDKFFLDDNYPNPFNPTTTIRFGLPERSHVRLTIYSIMGQKVKTLVNENLSAGYYRIQWNGTDQSGSRVSSGVYIYELVTDYQRLVKKMVLTK